MTDEQNLQNVGNNGLNMSHSDHFVNSVKAPFFPNHEELLSESSHSTGSGKDNAMALICKKEFEEALDEEIRLRASGAAPEISATGAGMLILRSAMPHPFLKKPLIFERQRIENAVLIPNNSLKLMARDVVKQLLPAITTSDRCWTCHVFALENGGQQSRDHKGTTDYTDSTDEKQCSTTASFHISDIRGIRGESSSQEHKTLSARARNFERILLEFCGERFARVFRRYRVPDEIERDRSAFVLNLCLVLEGIWGGVMPCERLSDPRPGGIHRMAFDRNAPCRSYLKVEEAFSLMGEKPEPTQSVIDLGASPGGWSYAFLKRGCHVIAVDNGPIRIERPEQYGGRLTHLKEDGVIFDPDPRNVPVDWLVSDMLVSTGKNIGMLRKWFSNRWMWRFVVNIKLPQTPPLSSLEASGRLSRRSA